MAFHGRDEYFDEAVRDLKVTYGSTEMQRCLRIYRSVFVEPFVRKLVEGTGLDAFISPSDLFYWFRPVVEELMAKGIPVLVQDKEGTIAPGPVMEEHARIVAERYPPIADDYFLWSESHLAFWRKAALPSTKGKVLGQPRSDFFFCSERWPSRESLGLPSTKKVVLAFTFDANAYAVVPGSTSGPSDRPWRTLRTEMHQSLIRLAEADPHVEIVVKAHPQQTDLPDILAEFESVRLPNLKVMTGAATASHLIINADVIVGFQSTAMIESMLTSRPVIYIGWSPVCRDWDHLLLPIHHSGGCHTPESRDEFEDMLKRALSRRLRPSSRMMQARRDFTRRYFHHADGGTSARILEAASRIVDSRGKSPLVRTEAHAT